MVLEQRHTFYAGTFLLRIANRLQSELDVFMAWIPNTLNVVLHFSHVRIVISS